MKSASYTKKAKGNGQTQWLRVWLLIGLTVIPALLLLVIKPMSFNDRHNRESLLDVTKWHTYRDEHYGFEIQYPLGASIRKGQYPKTTSITFSVAELLVHSPGYDLPCGPTGFGLYDKRFTEQVTVEKTSYEAKGSTSEYNEHTNRQANSYWLRVILKDSACLYWNIYPEDPDFPDDEYERLKEVIKQVVESYSSI